MSKVFLYPNTRDSIPAAFDDLQNYVISGQNGFLGRIFSSLGVASETDNTGIAVLSTDTNLKCTSDTPGHLTIAPGYAITSGFHVLYVAATDSRTLTEGTEYSYGDTIYLAYSGISSRLKEQAKGFFLDTTASGNVYTREISSWRVTTTDPGVSGVVLCSVAASDVVTDLRANNLLKFNHKLVDDIHIVKKDRENTLDMNLILSSGLVISDIGGSYEYTIDPLTGLTGNVTHSGIHLVTAISGQHTHGANNEYLTRIVTLTETKWAELDHFLNSGYTSSGGYQFLHDQNLRNVTTHPLYGFLQMGLINYQDGHGERQVLTRKVASIPNVPSGVTFSLIEERAPENATRKLRDAMRAYNYQEQAYVENMSAYASIASLRSVVSAYAAASGYTTSEDLQTDTYIMLQASGVVADAYATYDTLYLSATTSGYTTSEVLSQMYSLMGDLDTAKASINSELTVLGKDILSKGARMQVRPNAVINKKYHARLYWEEPALVDLENIIGYDVRIYRYNSDAVNPGAVTPETLVSNYTSDIIGVTNQSTANKRITLTALTGGTAKDPPSSLVGSDDPYAWNLALRVYISDADYTAMDPDIGNFITIVDDTDGTTETKTLVKHGTDTGLSAKYLQFAEPFSFIPQNPDIITQVKPTWDTSTANTSVMFPIDIDQAYIAYVRAVNEFNMASAWTTAVYQRTNDLPDNQGVVLISGVQDDAEYLAQINTIQKNELLRGVTDQLANLERAQAAAPDNASYTALVQTVAEYQASL